LAIKQQIGDKTQIYNLNVSARLAARRGDFPNAERLYQAALESPAQDPTALLEGNDWLARLYADHGRPDAAAAQYRKTLALIDGERAAIEVPDYKLFYVASLIHFHRDYVSFLMKGGQTEAALEAVEASRARLLKER